MNNVYSRLYHNAVLLTSSSEHPRKGTDQIIYNAKTEASMQSPSNFIKLGNKKMQI